MGGFALDARVAEETGAFALFDPIGGDQGDRDARSGGPRHKNLSGFGLCRGDNLVGSPPRFLDRSQDLGEEVIIACTVSSSKNS